MKPDGGGIRRLTHLLTASLLLHLAVLIVVSVSCRRKPVDHRQSLPMKVDYLDSGAKRKRALQNPPIPLRVAQISHPVSAPPRPVAPAEVVQLPEPAGGALSSPVPDQRRTPREASSIRLPVSGTSPPGMISTETVAGLVAGGPRKGSGSGSGGSGGFGADADRHGGGSAGTQGVGTSLPEASLQLRGVYLAHLRSLIEAHKEYPLAARKSRLEGSCQRRFVINRGGSLKQVEALSSCGCDFLDDAATRAITAVGKFPPLPDYFKGGEESFTVPIKFKLPSN